MERLELRAHVATYCDVCGEEITGNSVSSTRSDGVVFHAHADWDERRDGRCSDQLSDVAAGRQPAAQVPSAFPEGLLERVRELSGWQCTGTLNGDALRLYARTHWEGHPQAMVLAEADTSREALRYVASLTAPLVAPAPPVAEGEPRA